MTDSPLDWARRLPDDDLREMLLAISDVTGNAWGGEPDTVLGRLETTLVDWKATAEASAYPTTDAEIAALPIARLADFHTREEQL